MGFYMDRHDLAGTTAADLAAAHMSDLETQGKHGVRFVSYWFDYDRSAAFCLVEAPDAETAQAVPSGRRQSDPSGVLLRR